jgi:hypothetical protein
MASVAALLARSKRKLRGRGRICKTTRN